MHFEFYKYHGTGNDFILIDNRQGFFVPAGNIVRSLCDRRFGIGADGLILMNGSGKTDFTMVYFNSDGKESTLCGNGGRCLAAFARKLGFPGLSYTFEAIDGAHRATILQEMHDTTLVELKMNDIELPAAHSTDGIIDTGSPHLVRFVNDLDHQDIVSQGREIRNSEPFRKHGINVNFIELRGDAVSIRTYERGVENETLSCGTGVVASALAVTARHPSFRSPVRLKTAGGELTVRFKVKNNLYYDIWLEGPASFVYRGEINI